MKSQGRWNRAAVTLGRPWPLTGGLVIIGMLTLGAGTPSARTSPQQDMTFRVINLERQVETLRMRLDFLEQSSRQPVAADPLTTPVPPTIDLQRQILALAEQQVLMQTQLLELKKSVDRLGEKAPALK